MIVTIQQQTFIINPAGTSPVQVWDNNSQRVFIIVGSRYNFGPSDAILCTAADGNLQSLAFFLKDEDNLIIRQRDFGEFVHNEMYLADLAGGQPIGTFAVTQGILS